MKHLSKKINLSLLATVLTLSSTSGASSQIVVETRGGTTYGATTEIRLNDPQFIIASLRKGEATLEKALIAGAEAQEIAIKLQEQNDVLKSKAATLKFQNAVLNAQKVHAEEHKTPWQRFKSWVSKIDVKQVVTIAVKGIITIVGMVLIMIL